MAGIWLWYIISWSTWHFPVFSLLNFFFISLPNYNRILSLSLTAVSNVTVDYDDLASGVTSGLIIRENAGHDDVGDGDQRSKAIY